MQQLALIARDTIRARISHTHTLKEGWRCNETTVELTHADDNAAFPMEEMRLLMAEAHEAAREEAQRRNVRDGD